MKRIARLCVAAAGGISAVAAATYDIPLSAGSTEITIYRGDSVALAVEVSGTASSTIGSGTFAEPIDVSPGDMLSRAFPDPGLYAITVHDAAGEAVSSRLVHVVSVDLSSPVACEIGYTRAVGIPVELHGAQITFASSDPGLLSVALDAVEGSRATVSATPHGRGAAAIQAIIEAPTGPVVVGEREVDEFTIRSHLEGGFIFHRHDDGFGEGVFGFTMGIDYVFIEVDFFVPTMSANGLTYFRVPGSDLDPDGTWTAPFLLAPDSAMSCHRLQVFQPTAE